MKTNAAKKLIIAELKRQIKQLKFDNEVLEQALSDKCVDYEDFCKTINIATLEVRSKHIRYLVNKLRGYYDRH